MLCGTARYWAMLAKMLGYDQGDPGSPLSATEASGVTLGQSGSLRPTNLTRLVVIAAESCMCAY